jgi:hypothetical protein
MEDTLNVYHQPYDPQFPQINFDERPCELIGDVIMPIPIKSGQPKREDYHYERNGICNVFMAFEPKTGHRIVEIRKQKTRIDYAHFFQKVSAHYKDAKQIIVVQDNLNTHSKASFYQAFEPQKAFELSQRFEMHYTPKKGSWLNMVEIEFSAMSKQCLDRRIGDQQTLEKEVLAWVCDRNQKGVTVNWQFSILDARDKFKRFYPHKSLPE